MPRRWGPADSRAALDRAGGLALLSLELAAVRLAAMPQRRAGAAAASPQPAGLDDRHVACNLFLAGGGYKPPGRNPTRDLAWLLTDRLRGSLWTMVHGQLARLPDSVVKPPLRPLHRRPEACALAVCLRLTPLVRGSEDELRELEEFVVGLPDPLLEDTGALAHRLVSTGALKPGRDRGELERSLIADALFMRKVVPGSPTAPSSPSASRSAPAVTVAPRPGAPVDFEEALRRVAGAESEVEVDLIQCDDRWLDEWADLRAALDAELLAAALRGRARVRRIVRFDISADADRRMTRLHYRWTDALSTAVGCFEPRTGAWRDAPSPFAVRLLILPFADSSMAPPDDCAVLRTGDVGAGPDGDRARRFESIWARFDRDARIPAASLGLIELGGRGGPAGPAAESPFGP